MHIRTAACSPAFPRLCPPLIAARVTRRKTFRSFSLVSLKSVPPGYRSPECHQCVLVCDGICPCECTCRMTNVCDRRRHVGPCGPRCELDGSFGRVPRTRAQVPSDRFGLICALVHVGLELSMYVLATFQRTQTQVLSEHVLILWVTARGSWSARSLLPCPRNAKNTLACIHSTLDLF